MHIPILQDMLHIPDEEICRDERVKVRVKIYPCVFNWCATIYSEDAKKILEAVEKAKKELRDVFPLADDVYIEFDVLSFDVGESALEKSEVGYTDALVLNCNTLEEFVETIKNFLNKRKIEYEIEIEE